MSQKRITVSTSGIIPKMEELGQAEVRPKLAISLNASNEEQRRELMPITRKYHLADLLEACKAYPLRTWEKLTFEYVLLKDVNDTDADARRVVRLISRLNCKVNLIALNPGPGIAFGTPTDERVASFQEIVRKAVPCFVRKPRGRDIFAACGQLKRVNETGRPLRARRHGDLDFRGDAGGWRDGAIEILQGFQMALNGFVNVQVGLFKRLADCDGAREIWNIGGSVALSLFE